MSRGLTHRLRHLGPQDAAGQTRGRPLGIYNGGHTDAFEQIQDYTSIVFLNSI
jgi:hypothetical protein